MSKFFKPEDGVEFDVAHGYWISIDSANSKLEHESSRLSIALSALNEIMNVGVTMDGNTAEATIAYETLDKLGYWHE